MITVVQTITFLLVPQFVVKISNIVIVYMSSLIRFNNIRIYKTTQSYSSEE